MADSLHKRLDIVSVILQADNVVLCVLESHLGEKEVLLPLLIIIILLISLLLVIDCVLHCLNCSSKVAARLYLHFVLVYLQICCARVTGYGASYHSSAPF